MDMIGLSSSEIRLCNRLYTTAVAYWVKKDSLLANKGKQRPVDIACSLLRELLVIVGDSNNFHLFVAAERIICHADLKHFQHSQQDNPNVSGQTAIMTALQEGVDQMEKINDQLTLRDKDIHLFHHYSSGTRALKSDFDREGLPKDGIRKLLSSHKTRLQNESKGMHRLGNEERDLLWHRQRNMQMAEQRYIEMQREALGDDGRSQSRERQR